MEKQVIIYYLQNTDLEQKLWEQARDLRKKMLNIQEEREQLKTEILYASQVSISVSETPRSKTNNVKDLNDVIEQTEKKLCSYEKELLCLYSGILDKMDECKRVNLAFDTLLPLDREIIRMLYIDNQTWEAVEIDMEINHRILVEKVNDIFTYLSEKIDSKLSNIELAAQKNTFRLLKPIKKKKTSSDKEIKGQKDVYDFFQVLKEEQDAKKVQ